MSKLPDFLIGIDLGQSADFSTNTISQRSVVDGVSHYGVVHLQRYELGLAYPRIVEDVVKMTKTPQLAGNYLLVVDRTGVGRPVYDLFKDAGLKPIGISISAGREANQDPDDRMCWTVPRIALVSCAKVLLQSERLKFAKGLPNVQDLIEEMLSFEMKFTAAQNVTMEAWRTGTHDDLLLGLCVALWFGEFGQTWSNPKFAALSFGVSGTAQERAEAEIKELSDSRKVRIRQLAGAGHSITTLARQMSLSSWQIERIIEGQ
ncbi:MAG: hypothetical protein ACC700_13660 [Anaerolineales bacterium]